MTLPLDRDRVAPGAPDDWRSLGLHARLRWLGWGGATLLAVCMLLLPLIDVSLRLRGYVRTRNWLGRLLASRSSAPVGAAAPADAAASASRVALIVGIAARKLPWPATCLRQALLCRTLLARRGVASELRIGVDMVDGFAAHAWVEHGGRVIIGGEHARERYRVMM